MKKLLFIIKQSALNRGMNTGIENIAWQLASVGMEISVIAGGKKPKSYPYIIPENTHYFFTGGDGLPGDHYKLYSEMQKKADWDAVIGWIRNIDPLARKTYFGELHRPLFIGNEGEVYIKQNPAILSNLKPIISLLKHQNKIVRLRHLLMNYKNTRIDAVVAISEAVRKNVELAYSIPKQHITVIPRGVDTEFFRPSYESSTIHSSSFLRIIYTGNINKEKGLGDVVESLKMIKHPVEFILCGKDQGYLSNLCARIEGTEGAPSIICKGVLDPLTLKEELLASDIFIFCSHNEGLGKSLLEAMSCGLPVIVSDIEAFREVVIDEVNALVVPKNNPAQIAKAINKYMDDEKLRVSCGAAARQTIVKSYNKNIELTGWISLINQLIEQKHEHTVCQ